jgi:methyl-accepting chemotaxis protein
VWAIRGSVLRPLADGGEAAEKRGPGDLSVRLPEYKSWELAEVSTTFNEMAGKLEHQATDLRETAEELRSELEGMEEIQSLLSSGAGLAMCQRAAATWLGARCERRRDLARWPRHREAVCAWRRRT